MPVNEKGDKEKGVNVVERSTLISIDRRTNNNNNNNNQC